MSENSKKTKKAPKALIEQAEDTTAFEAAAVAEEERTDARAGSKQSKKTGSFQDATVGFFQGAGRMAWAYADAHPHAVLYGLIGFVLAVLILVIGLWDTIVIAVFAGVGTAVGQMVDGDNAIVNFFSRLFGGKR